MKMIENNDVETGHPSNVLETLNRKIGQFKRNYNSLKVGITGRNPQERFDEHLNQNNRWQRMVVIYETSSERYANEMEELLVAHHKNYLVNDRKGGGSQLSAGGKNYVYVLLA